jgi:hypothetical protein
MPLHQLLLTGPNLLFTPMSFVVPPVEPLHWKRNRFGSTVDRPFSWKIGGGAGKSFTTVPAKPYGGPGAAIDRPPS